MSKKSYKLSKETFEAKIVGRYKSETTRFSTDRKSGVTFEDLKGICDVLNTKYAGLDEDDFAYLITAKTITGNFFTLKGFYQEELNSNSIEEYLNDRVKDETKFEKLYSVNVTTRKRIK